MINMRGIGFLEPTTMEGPRKTPERTPVNDGDEGIDDSSPLKPVAGHNTEEVAERTMPTTLHEVSLEQMHKLLGTTKAEMDDAFPVLPTMATTLKELKSSFNENIVTKYLDHLSDMVHKHLGWSTNATVINKLTRQTLRKAPGGHPFLQPQ
jgi:hypothetical protein